MTGGQAAPSAPQDGRRTWTSVEPVARDVSVAVGEFDTASATGGGGVGASTGRRPGADGPPPGRTAWVLAASAHGEHRLRPPPYPTLPLPLPPSRGGGHGS